MDEQHKPATEHEQYLVVLCCDDDAPVFLTPDLPLAEQIAWHIARERVIPDWLEMDWPQTTFDHVEMVTFRNGRPVKVKDVGPARGSDPLFGGGDHCDG